jgi:hypothetical protein
MIRFVSLRSCAIAPPSFGGDFDEARLARELSELEAQISAADFWSNATKAQQVMQQRRRLDDDRQLD